RQTLRGVSVRRAVTSRPAHSPPTIRSRVPGLRRVHGPANARPPTLRALRRAGVDRTQRPRRGRRTADPSQAWSIAWWLGITDALRGCRAAKLIGQYRP